MRVYNEVIDVHLHGDASVKQYSGTGPLIVRLQGDRGEVHAQAGDYILYLGGVAIGVVTQDFLDPLREEDEPLDPENPVPTGAILEATVLDHAGAPLAGTSVFLGQGNTPIAEGKTDADGLVVFGVLPGTYQIRPKDKAKGPVQTVEAVIETPEAPPPPEGGVLANQGASKTRRPKPDNTLPGNRFDVEGRPDPRGNYDSKGQLLGPEGRR